MSIYLELIGKGIGLGFILALFVGPVFFSLLYTSIHYGFKSGINLALGIIISDAVYIGLAVFGVAKLLKENNLHFYMGYVGGAFMIIYGAILFFKRVQVDKDAVMNKLPWYALIAKGFFLNFLNPSVLIYWIAMVSAVGADYNYEVSSLTILMGTTLATVFATDTLKAYFSSKIKRFLTYKLLSLANMVLGVALAIFGIYIIIYVSTKLF